MRLKSSAASGAVAAAARGLLNQARKWCAREPSASCEHFTGAHQSGDPSASTFFKVHSLAALSRERIKKSRSRVDFEHTQKGDLHKFKAHESLSQLAPNYNQPEQTTTHSNKMAASTLQAATANQQQYYPGYQPSGATMGHAASQAYYSTNHHQDQQPMAYANHHYPSVAATAAGHHQYQALASHHQLTCSAPSTMTNQLANGSKLDPSSTPNGSSCSASSSSGVSSTPTTTNSTASLQYSLEQATKSTKGASKLRRDLINTEIAQLRELLPLPASTRQRLSQLQLMALVLVYVRKSNYFCNGKLSFQRLCPQRVLFHLACDIESASKWPLD